MKEKRNIKSKRFSKFFSFMAAVTLLAFTVGGCNFLSAVSGGGSSSENKVDINSLMFIRQNMSIKAGEIQLLSLNVSPSSARGKFTPAYEYDRSVISVQPNSQGAIIEGLKEGTTTLFAKYNGYDTVCIVNVSGYTEDYEREPYLYANTQMFRMESGDRQQVVASLYGGTVSDQNGFTWLVEDDPNVVDIQTNGQYADVFAKNPGYTRVKVTHTKAAYPFYFGFYVFSDLTKATYLTTSGNILTLRKNDGKQGISVNLINPKTEVWEQPSNFTWETVKEDGQAEDVISVVANGKNAEVTPLKAGQATLRVKHAESQFPLDIIVQVVEIVENVYIEPNGNTNLTTILSGTTEKTLSFKLANIKEGRDYSADDFSFEVENEDVLEYYTSGNNITVVGKKNGSSQIYVRHPLSKRDRQVLVIVNEHPNDAINSDVYITTSQNYVKTKIGADDTNVSIILKNGKQGDEKDFTWTVSHQATDGTKDNVIEVQTTTGAVARASARAVTYTSAVGYAVITPKKEGTATISISHPKSLYTTEILVKVLGANAILDNPLSIDGEGIIRFLNSETYDASVNLYGSTKAGDNAKIKWATESAHLRLQANENKAMVSSTRTGELTGQIVVTHPNAVNPKNILVLSADTEEELYSMKAFYSDKTYWSVNEGDTFRMAINQVGWDGTYDESSDSYIPEGFSGIRWTSSRADIAFPETSADDPLTPVITAVKAGVAKIKVEYQGVSAEFTVTVYPKGTPIDAVERTRYLTTGNNVVNLAPNAQKTVTVSMIGINESEAGKMQWNYTGDIVEVKPNGKSAVIIAKQNGEGEITVTHPKSENTLKIHARVGEEFVTTDANVCYIRANQDIFTVVKDSKAQTLTVSLVNGTQAESGFSFTIDDVDIARIQGISSGRCYITPTLAGMAEITVSHPEAAADKKILVVVGNTEEELKGFKYLTTSSNVINVGEGSTRNVSVSLANSDELALDGFTWTTENIRIAGIHESTSSTAVIVGNGIGTTKIIARHDSCKYPLEIIVNVVDPKQMASLPYVTTPTNVLILQTNDTGYKTVTAELAGGTKEDQKNLVWESSNPKILAVLAQNGEARVKALDTGTAYITISHPKTNFSAQVLVVCERGGTSECYLSTQETIITMRPTDRQKTVVVQLNGGTTGDRNGFKWSPDVFDIVDITQTGTGTAVISPKQQGEVQITVSHPKAASDLVIIVKVTEYTTFGFGVVSKQITKGATTFQVMQVPSSNTKMHVEYESTSPKVVSVSGTKAVCQLTALEEGTSTVTAKLIDSTTNKEQARSEMLVYVSPGSSDLVYITSTNNIVTIEKNQNKTLSATLVGNGVTNVDQQNLTWRSDNPEILEVRGASTTGSVAGTQAMFTAKNSGETTITVTHEKSKTNLVIYVIVPGDADLTLTLNKTYIQLDKNKSSELKATIAGGKTQDYADIEWSADRVNSDDIVRVMGSGQTVTVYGVKSGVTTVYAQLPNGNKVQCQVEVSTAKTLEFTVGSLRVMPGEDKELKYRLSPSDAKVTWTLSNSDSIQYSDLGMSGEEGTLVITGLKATQSPVTLLGVTEYGSRAQIQVTCSWDYLFWTDKTRIAGTPGKDYRVAFQVNPAHMDIVYDDIEGIDVIVENNGDGTGCIVVNSQKQIEDVIMLRAVNPKDRTGFSNNERKLDVNFYYDLLTLQPSIKSRDGSFSEFLDSETLSLGDGEALTIGFGVREKVEYEIEEITFVPASKDIESIVEMSDFKADEKKLIHKKDYIENEYLIKTGWVPTYGGRRYSPKDFVWKGLSYYHGKKKDDNYVLLLPGVSTMSASFCNCSHEGFMSGAHRSKWAYAVADEYGTFYGMLPQSYIEHYQYDSGNSNGDMMTGQRTVNLSAIFSRTRDTSLDGKRMRKGEFEAVPWFFASSVYYGTGAHVKISPHVITQNIDASLVPVLDATLRDKNYMGEIRVKIKAWKSGSKGKEVTYSYTIAVVEARRPCVYNLPESEWDSAVYAEIQ